MKELLKQIKQYKKDSILAPVYSALEVVMEVIIPFVMALLIDEGVEKGNMNKILLYGIIMIVLAMISLFAGMMAGKYAASASSGFACNLREAMLSLCVSVAQELLSAETSFFPLLIK